MCYLWSERWGVGDYLGSDISIMLLSKSFSWYPVLFETGQLIIWGLWKRWSDYLGVRENCLTLAPPFQTSRSFPLGLREAVCSSGTRNEQDFLKHRDTMQHQQRQFCPQPHTFSAITTPCPVISLMV